MRNFVRVPVNGFMVCDDDENVHHADNTLSFADTNKLLQKLRTENPDIEYTMFAEIDA